MEYGDLTRRHRLFLSSHKSGQVRAELGKVVLDHGLNEIRALTMKTFFKRLIEFISGRCLSPWNAHACSKLDPVEVGMGKFQHTHGFGTWIVRADAHELDLQDGVFTI